MPRRSSASLPLPDDLADACDLDTRADELACASDELSGLLLGRRLSRASEGRVTALIRQAQAAVSEALALLAKED